jgi:sugar lactone lactonase YvrE
VESHGPELKDGIILKEPSGLAVSKIGDIFISDRAANAIYKLSSGFEFMSEEGGIGSAPGTFSRPMGVACDAALNVYVADSGNRRIQILDRNLRYVGTIDSYFDETDQSEEFSLPEDIDMDREGNFWIADNDRVIKLDPFYEQLLEISYDAPGSFTIGRASCLAISGNDIVAIGDTGNRQVINITVHGSRVSELDFGAPSSLAWDNGGLLWVADARAGMLEAYDIEGDLRYKYAEAVSGFKPSSIVFDLSGRLLVVDAGRRQILVYEIVRGSQR